MTDLIPFQGAGKAQTLKKKKDIEAAALAFAADSLETNDSLTLALYLKRLELFVKTVAGQLKQKAVEMARLQGPEGKDFYFDGAKIRVCETGASWDYQKDPILLDLEEKVKDRKKFLQSVKPEQHLEEANPVTGEMYRVKPAIKKAETGITITL
jgi:hypothetical protein